MTTATRPADSAAEIQQQMRQVRRELGEDVDEIVENARILADWKHYVRTYPWVCLGVAAAAGFIIVPSRTHIVRPDAKELAAWAKSQKLVIEPASQAKPRTSLMGTIGGMAANALLQGGLAVLRNYLAGMNAPRPAVQSEVCEDV
jgi:hypothetical protein